MTTIRFASGQSLPSFGWPPSFSGALVIALIVIVALWRVSLLIKGLFPVRKDPQRLFTKQQRVAGYARCGARCEHKNILWFRCGNKQMLQGDHIYPHSKGGATIESNLQMLCQKHNGRKSAMVPSRFYIKRLERRRRSYFPSNYSTRIAWKR